MKKLLYLCLLAIVGCTQEIDLTQQNAITEKMQDANSRKTAKYTVVAPGAGSGRIVLILPDDWGRVGDIVVCTNRAITSKTPTVKLED